MCVRKGFWSTFDTNRSNQLAALAVLSLPVRICSPATGVTVTRTKKVLATIALVLGITGAAAGPALADNHAPVGPQDSVVVTLENAMP
jgi:hypothetical protein